MVAISSHSLQGCGDEFLSSIRPEGNIAMENIEQELIAFGLSRNEAKTYVFLALHGPQKARKVSEAIRIHRTETYHLLTRLQNKGIITATFQYPIEFIAEPFDKTIRILTNLEKEKLEALEKKKPRLNAIWKSLPVYEPTEIDKERFQILQGATLIYHKLKEMAAKAKRTVIITGIDRDIAYLDEFNVLRYLRNLGRNHISCKILQLGSNGGKVSEKMRDIDFRVAEWEKPNLPHFLTADSQELILFLNRGTVQRKYLCALWTNCNSLIQIMEVFFTSLWKDLDHSKSGNLASSLPAVEVSLTSQ